MKFFLPFAALVVSAAAQNTIIDDINQNIAPALTKLANDVQSFPNSSLCLYGLQEINSDSENLVKVVNTATKNARNYGFFSQIDGVTILSDLGPVMDTTNDLLGELIAKKDDINSRPILPGGSLILSDLQSLNQSFIEYLGVIADDAPLLEVVAYLSIRDVFANAFKQALEDYS